MLSNERDALWGLTVTTIGYEEIGPNDPYPTRGHADGYYFELEKGRILSEYQLLYIIEGEGVFHSRTVPEAHLKVNGIVTTPQVLMDGRNTGLVSRETTWMPVFVLISFPPQSQFTM